MKYISGAEITKRLNHPHYRVQQLIAEELKIYPGGTEIF
jgi:hypothetical protein